MPTDPKELMALASRLNNLTNEDRKPWHLRATFKLLDDQGNTTDEGTYEELWAGPNKNKVTYTSPAFTRTDYRTDHGLLRTGSDPPSNLIIIAGQEFVDPLPNRDAISHEAFELQQQDSGNVRLACLTIPSNLGHNYCLDNLPALRVSIFGFQSLQVLHNRILKFQDQYVAGDLQFMRTGKTVLTAHLEKIETLDPVNDADFAPSPDAILIPLRINIAGAVAQGMLLQKTTPEYPLDAKLAGITGTVVLQGQISKEGRITELRVISGPAALQQASLDAVRTWRYRPYLLNGEPVAVLTTINVVFNLNR
jgi:TonB family protein